jgi:hypothetical protein
MRAHSGLKTCKKIVITNIPICKIIYSITVNVFICLKHFGACVVYLVFTSTNLQAVRVRQKRKTFTV